MGLSSKAFVQSVKRMGATVAVIYVAICTGMFFFQRSLLYFPSHEPPRSKLVEWTINQQRLGYCHVVENPNTVWFMMHGNGGQASDRDYVLARMAPTDSLYVLEYPGYGARTGRPCRQAFDLAAREAYEQLSRLYPNTPLGIIGESIGSGPACSLASAPRKPDKIILLVPFDSLFRVAANRFYFLPVRLLLLDRWDNVQALSDFDGPVEIFAARDDVVIPPYHAQALADQTRNAQIHCVPGGHNDWSYRSEVKIER